MPSRWAHDDFSRVKMEPPLMRCSPANRSLRIAGGTGGTGETSSRHPNPCGPPCRLLPVGHAVRLIPGSHLGLDAEVSGREHQEFVVVAAGDVQVLAIGTDSD